MNKIRVLIVEDEWIVSEEIKELLSMSGFLVIGQAEDALTALELLATSPIDVALLDINLKGPIDGIELAKKIIEKQNVAIIFLTAFDDAHFINRAKAVKPAAYIVKPYQSRNLEMAIEMAFNNLAEANSTSTNDSYFISDHIFLREQNRFRKVALSSIYFAEAVGSYTDIFFEDKKHTLSINLKTFHSRLDDANFLRVHRSYAVNLAHVEEFEGNRIFIQGKPIPIGSSYREEFLRRFTFL
jgi:two-component system, response regulator PdtaR